MPGDSLWAVIEFRDWQGQRSGQSLALAQAKPEHTTQRQDCLNGKIGKAGLTVSFALAPAMRPRLARSPQRQAARRRRPASYAGQFVTLYFISVFDDGGWHCV
ncbi:hypothetical protein GCM10010869_30300 [Mesorhizobium tianshanense]|uniref:Uncharacterized protein n=1 Tax=Mesorhizobium tianshanense TaxID=39844 RepID=A0A562MV16_9HYPH|nr:hypothetical protein IQ26_06415 [Mesorhizobium tianshanense]GLS37437.1 hypothetical protein GCM10010869_30300 [Mesorhizobium tianshanense]